MTETNVFELTQPGTFSDPLTEVLRNGARTLLGQAVEAEVAAWLSTHTDKLTDDGRRRLVRHGHMPEREVMTGIGAVVVRCPRVRDRVGEGGEKAKRNLSGSSTACARARNRGKSSSSTSNGGGLRWDPSSRSPTVPSASGRRSKRYGRGHAASAVGCTRPPMS